MSIHAQHLLEEVFDVLRQGANDPALHYLELGDLRRATDVFCYPFISLLECCIAQLPLMIVRRHVTDSRLAEFGTSDRTWAGWIRLLTPKEREGCLHDLAFEKIDGLFAGDVNYLDDAAETWINVIRLLFCPHVVVASIDRGRLPDIDGFVNAIKHLDIIIDATLHGKPRPQDQSSSGETTVAQADPIRTALPGMLVLPPMPWEQFRVNWCEHLGELDPVLGDPKQVDWDWLIDDSHYLIAFRADSLVTSAAGAVQHYMRRLVALSRCFRVDHDWSTIVEKNGCHEVVLNHTTPARCRILAMPLEIPKLLLSNLRPSDDRMAILCTRGEFRLAGRPFVTPGELKDDWIRDLERAWQWLSNYTISGPDRIWHVVEAYEIACSLGRNLDIPSVYREGWQLVGLMTAVESLLPNDAGDFKQAEIEDEARRLMRMTQEPLATVDRCCAYLRSAYRFRNEFVHTGNCGWNDGEIADICCAVGRVIRAAIRSEMSTAAA